MDNAGDCSPGLIDLTSDGSDRFRWFLCDNLVDFPDKSHIPNYLGRSCGSGFVFGNHRGQFTIYLEPFADSLHIPHMKTGHFGDIPIGDLTLFSDQNGQNGAPQK